MERPTHAVRGDVLTFHDDPHGKGIDDCASFIPDALIVLSEGKIVEVGPASEVELADDIPVTRYRDAIILAGFVDCHVHYPQTQMIAAPMSSTNESAANGSAANGDRLIDWLNRYTFLTEQSFASYEHAREVAKVYLDECLRNGTTTASVFCTVHPESVEAFFDESHQRNMRNLAGKVLMDRNAPEELLDTPRTAYDQSKALIEKWHGRGRQLYCVTPRFAPTSSPEQLEAAGAVWGGHEGTYLQTHLSETKREIEWVRELFPNHSGYLDVYDQFGLLGPRSMLGHGIHLSEPELERLSESGGAIVHCPTSNLFLGSGLFSLPTALREDRPVRLGVGSDLGAGTSFSPLQTLNETYKVAQLNDYPIRALEAFYLATRGGARALYLEDTIGSVAPGMEGDLVVLDLHSTPIIRHRMKYCESLEEALFVQMIMGDDRAIRATYVAGTLAYDRDAQAEPFLHSR